MELRRASFGNFNKDQEVEKAKVDDLGMNRILIDTHILIFAASNSLSRKQSEIQKASDQSILVSAIRLWEIPKLSELGKIKLPDGLNDFLYKIENHSRYEIVPIHADVLIKMTVISPQMHKDPADQLIVASALAYKARLMTHDRLIIQSHLVEVV